MKNCLHYDYDYDYDSHHHDEDVDDSGDDDNRMCPELRCAANVTC